MADKKTDTNKELSKLFSSVDGKLKPLTPEQAQANKQQAADYKAKAADNG